MIKIKWFLLSNQN